MRTPAALAAAAILSALLAAFLGVRAARAQTRAAPAANLGLQLPPSGNLLRNADLARGAGNSPDNWRTEAWIEGPTAVNYIWRQKTAASAGELIVNNLKPDDARWMQSLTLGPGFYHISVNARVSGVRAGAVGANVALMEDGVRSPDIVGTTAGWRRVGLYLKVGAHGADVAVALRLGGYGSLNSGEAFFSNPSVVRIAALPPDAAPVFDLSTIRREARHVPVGKPWTLAAAVIAALIVAVVGWRLFGQTDGAPPISRAERRRRAGRG